MARRWLVVVVGAVALAGCGGGGGSDDAGREAPAADTCERVTVPGHQGTDVRASGLDCDAAATVVRDAEGRGRASYESGGLTCEPDDADDGDTVYTCTGDGKRVTFTWGTTASAAADDGARQLGPAAFARAAGAPGTTTVNVHVPYEGELSRTDRFVDYRTARTAALPRGRRIALYCRSGHMSRIAARALRARGFDDLVELRGGMEAWSASGRPVLRR